MKDYRNDVIVDFLMAYGEFDQNTEGDDQEELGITIRKMARENLTKVKMLAFFYAFRCEDSWEDIARLFMEEHGRSVTAKSVSRYGREAKKILREKLTEVDRQNRNRRRL